jgi:hypothetical protein
MEYSDTFVPWSFKDTDIKRITDWYEEHMCWEEAKAGDEYYFESHVIHRASYHGQALFGRIFEVAYGINDEEDIVRLDDNYGRDSSPNPDKARMQEALENNLFDKREASFSASPLSLALSGKTFLIESDSPIRFSALKSRDGNPQQTRREVEDKIDPIAEGYLDGQ